jgi:hypothetical protein
MPQGSSNASASAYEVNTRRSELFGYVLLAGLGVELLFAIALSKPWIDWLSTLLSDAVIVIGVWGEIHFGRLARIAGDVAQAAANARAEEANQKASEADARATEAALELARLKARRGLSEEQIESMFTQLAPFAKHPVTVCASPRMFESEWFADQLAKVLRNSGVDANRTDHWATVTIGAKKGVIANFGSESERGRRFATAVCDALNERGVSSEPADGLMWRGASPGDWVLIVVGERP